MLALQAQPAEDHSLEFKPATSVPLKHSRQDVNLAAEEAEGARAGRLQGSRAVTCGQQVQGSPHVGLPAVAFPADHLGAHPVRRAGDRADPCPRHADRLQPLAGPKVPQLHVASRVTQDVGTWSEAQNEASCVQAAQLLDLQNDIQPQRAELMARLLPHQASGDLLNITALIQAADKPIANGCKWEKLQGKTQGSEGGREMRAESAPALLQCL